MSPVDVARVIEDTAALVRIDSQNPGALEGACARWVHDRLSEAGLDVHELAAADGRDDLLATVTGSGERPRLVLLAHMDTVPIGEGWTVDPLGGQVRDRRIWGRGAADMKGGLAAAMIAAAAIKRSGARLGGRLVVGALVDEEGDMLGVRRFTATPLAGELTAAIVCEPEQNELCLEQRGVVWARVAVRGRMAHGAMPEAGANPLTVVGALLSEAPRLERRLRRLCARSRYLKPPTVTPTIVRSPLGGVPQSNVIPATAEVVLDVRLTPGPDANAVAAEIDRACRAAAQAVPGVSVEWQPVNGFRSATRVAREEPLVRAMTWAVKAATGRRAVFGGVPGSTDGTILRETLGIPIVTCGPGHRLIPHQVDEYVKIAELVDAAKIYVASALKYLEAS